MPREVRLALIALRTQLRVCAASLVLNAAVVIFSEPAENVTQLSYSGIECMRDVGSWTRRMCGRCFGLSRSTGSARRIAQNLVDSDLNAEPLN